MMNKNIYDVSGKTKKEDDTYGFAAYVAARSRISLEKEKETHEIFCTNTRYHTPDKITLHLEKSTSDDNRYYNPLLKSSVHFFPKRDSSVRPVPTISGTLAPEAAGTVPGQQVNMNEKPSPEKKKLESDAELLRTVPKCTTMGTFFLVFTLLLITGTTALVLFLTVGKGLALFTSSERYVVNGEFRIVNVSYHPSQINNRDSAEYKKLSAAIQNSLDGVFKKSHVFADLYNQTFVKSLTPVAKGTSGNVNSVRVEFQTVINVPDMLAAEKMGLVFLGSLTHRDKQRYLADFGIDITSISFSETLPADTAAVFPTVPLVKWGEWSNWTSCPDPCSPLHSQTRHRKCFFSDSTLNDSPSPDPVLCTIAAVNSDGSSDVQRRPCVCSKPTSRPRIPFNVVRTTKLTNVTNIPTPTDRSCDSCRAGEVCVARRGENAPQCRWPPDSLDPTGCGGFCRVGTESCVRVSEISFRCEEHSSCSPNEWPCQNGLCIPANKRCDGQFNCYDHSDEHDCECSDISRMHCGNETSCIGKEKRCDGQVDCWDGSDELNCTSPCPVGQFTCTRGGCIAQVLFCDGFADCADGTDEPAGCGGSCRSHERKCRNGRCVRQHTFCDGFNTCGDNSDEENCSLQQPNHEGNSTGRLIEPRASHLLTRETLESLSDYNSCDSQTEFKCANWECVPKTFLCNGVNDCGDSSDEYRCELQSH